MITKVCDICGKIETPKRRDFYTFTYEWGVFKRVKGFHICPDCMKLIKELRAKQKEGGNDYQTNPMKAVKTTSLPVKSNLKAVNKNGH